MDVNVDCLMFNAKLQEIQSIKFGITCNTEKFKEDALNFSRLHFIENHNTCGTLIDCNLKASNFNSTQYQCDKIEDCSNIKLIDCSDTISITESSTYDKPIITELL